MKIGILPWEIYENRPYNSAGSSRIRGRWLVDNWDDAEQFIHGEVYDVVIYQKAYNRRHMQMFDGIKIFDICDKDWPERPLVEVMEKVDAFTCSTDALTEAIKKMRGDLTLPILTIPDRVSFKSVKRLKTEYGNGKAKKAVWYGYAHNFEAVKPALPDIANLGLTLTLITDQHPFTIRGYDVEVDSKEYKQERIYQDLAEADIIINPRIDRGKWKLKSNNKTIIAQAVGVPVAETADDLRRLMDPEERKKEAEKKYELVMDEYDITKSVKQFIDLIWQIQETKKA